MICYKSYPKPCPVRTPTARWMFRARQLCCRGPSTPPTTNFYKKPSSKKSISGITRSILLRKYFNFYFYVTNVFVVTGDRRECLGTFLGPYRLEKPPKIALHFSESITIGNSIQTDRLLHRVILASCRPCHRAPRKMTSRKSYWVLEAPLQNLGRRRCPPTCRRSSLSLWQQRPL